MPKMRDLIGRRGTLISSLIRRPGAGDGLQYSYFRDAAACRAAMRAGGAKLNFCFKSIGVAGAIGIGNALRY